MKKQFKLYEKLGIALMSTIMLSSIAPTLTNANASTSRQSQYHKTLTTKKYNMKRTHQHSNRKLKLMRKQLNTLRRELRHKRGKAKNKLQSKLRRKKKEYIIVIHQNRHQEWLINEYQKALNRLQNQNHQETLEINNLSKDLHDMKVQNYTTINNSVRLQAKNQQKIQQLERMHYQPAYVPKVMNFTNRDNNLTQHVYFASKAQKKPKNKTYVRQIANKEQKANNRLKNRIEGQEKDHLAANTRYIQHLIYQNKIINYGLSTHNKPLYNESINQLNAATSFNHATATGRRLERQAKNRAKSIEKNIGKRIKNNNTRNQKSQDRYTNSLLNAFATNDNSEAQYDENHTSINQVLNGIHNPKKRKAIMKMYKNVKKHKKNYNKYKKLYKSRHNKRKNKGKIKYHYHISKKGLKRYKGIMSKIDRLKATKQTKQVKAEEKALYEQAQGARKQQIQDIDTQIKGLADEITQQQDLYNKTKERWQDVNGNIPLRIKYHNQMDSIENNIKQLQKQIQQLESQAANIDDDITNAKHQNAKQKYYHMLLGNVKNIQPISHPAYVRISAPTYYFDNYDITNRANRDIKVSPNTPKDNIQHKVNSADNVTLNDGKQYIMYNISSNEGGNGEAYDYFILARYTTPVKHQKFRWNLHYMPLNESGRVTNTTSYYTSAKEHGKRGGNINALQTLHLEGLYYQGNDKNYKVLYKAITQYGKLFGKTHYGHKIMYIPAKDVNAWNAHPKKGHSDEEVPTYL